MNQRQLANDFDEAVDNAINKALPITDIPKMVKRIVKIAKKHEGKGLRKVKLRQAIEERIYVYQTLEALALAVKDEI